MAASEFAITIQDFSPGIWSDDHATHGGIPGSGSSTFRNGAATIANTYRCNADVSGALVPLPARVARMSEAMLPLGTGHTVDYPSGFEESYQEDIKIFSVTNSGAYPNAGDDVLVCVMHGWYYDYSHLAGNFSTYSLVRVYPENTVLVPAPTPFDVHYYRNGGNGGMATNPKVIPWGNFVHTVSHIAGQTPNTPGLGSITPMLAWVMCDSFANWGPLQLMATALTATDQSYTTFDTTVSNNFISDGQYGVVAAMHQSGTAGYTYPLSRMAANIATARPLPTFLLPIHINTTLLVGHQGRLIGCYSNSTAVANGFGAGGFELWFTYYPTYILHTGTPSLPDYAGELVALPENCNGAGVVASLNAQDLLIVNHYGGGAVISGSLVSPTVNVLPNLHSTYGVSCQGVNTPVGFVYGGRFGVYVYRGGQTQPISSQLNGFFWDHIAGSGTGQAIIHRHDGVRGRFGWWDPYVLVPNNYVYDTRNSSWWRLELSSTTQEPYNAYDVSTGGGINSGRLYAIPWRKTPTATVTYDRYDHYILAQSYSWQSQPMTESRDKMITPHEINLAAMPSPGTQTASIVLTLTGVDESGAALPPFIKTLPLIPGNLRPQHFRVSVPDFTAYHLQLRLEASATGANAAAPKVLPGVTIQCRDSSSFVTV